MIGVLRKSSYNSCRCSFHDIAACDIVKNTLSSTFRVSRFVRVSFPYNNNELGKFPAGVISQFLWQLFECRGEMSKVDVGEMVFLKEMFQIGLGLAR